MIDFRYHLVSLIAVFMALATGILVGSSLLNQSLIDRQKAQIKQQTAEKENLRQDLDTARNEINYRDQYLGGLDDALLPGRLAGQRVVLVTLPGASGGDAQGLTESLTLAGAKVTGRVGIADGFFASAEDPRDTAVKGETRDAIVRQNSIPELRGQPANVQVAAAVLTKGPDRPVSEPAKTLLSELDRGGFLNVGNLSDRADLAVLLVGPTPEEALGSTDRTRRGLVGLATAMDAAGNGVVVAGPSDAAVGGAMEGIRQDRTTRDLITTLDSVDTTFGRVATVFALVEQMTGGAGHYGASADADSPFPRLADPTAPKR